MFLRLLAIMLGRLRLDIETCKEVYVRMTRKVFISDKTFHGIPYRSTLFKASKLEEAIQECVREHTSFEEEGATEGSAYPGAPPTPTTPMSPGSAFGGSAYGPQRSISRASISSTTRTASGYNPVSRFQRWGNPNAPLYDNRENRTKT
jgi:hypothetical protein